MCRIQNPCRILKHKRRSEIGLHDWCLTAFKMMFAPGTEGGTSPLMLRYPGTNGLFQQLLEYWYERGRASVPKSPGYDFSNKRFEHLYRMKNGPGKIAGAFSHSFAVIGKQRESMSTGGSWNSLTFPRPVYLVGCGGRKPQSTVRKEPISFLSFYPDFQANEVLLLRRIGIAMQTLAVPW